MLSAVVFRTGLRQGRAESSESWERMAGSECSGTTEPPTHTEWVRRASLISNWRKLLALMIMRIQNCQLTINQVRFLYYEVRELQIHVLLWKHVLICCINTRTLSKSHRIIIVCFRKVCYKLYCKFLVTKLFYLIQLHTKTKQMSICSSVTTNFVAFRLINFF